MEEYDVIIAGAGPAGGNCARELAKMGRSVLLVESSKTIGEPNFSTAGTPNETMKAFELPRKVTDSPWSSLLVAGPHERAEFLFGKRMGYVLNYKLLKQFLAKEVKRKGGEVVTGTTVKDIIMKDRFVTGVEVRKNGETKHYFGKIVVDATGGRETLGRKLGLVDSKDGLMVGLEYHMDNISFERKERLDFYFGNVYVPGGYAWIFPMGQSSAKVGVGILQITEKYRKPIDSLKTFARTNRQTSSATIIEMHGGSLFGDGGIKNHVRNGFVVIGDAARQINPLGGEGIRHALYSGRFAAQAIDRALTQKDVSEKALEEYNRKWKQYIKNKWLVSFILQRQGYRLGDKNWDSFIKIFANFDPEDVFEIVFNYNFSKVKKYLPEFFGMISKTLLLKFNTDTLKEGA